MCPASDCPLSRAPRVCVCPLGEPKERQPFILTARQTDTSVTISQQTTHSKSPLVATEMEWWSSGSSGCEGSGSSDESGEALRQAITAGDLLEGEGRLRVVRRLDLSLAALEKVPAPLEQCTRLNELSLRSNRLEALPKWISRLHAIRNLNLAGNRLQHFPPEILDLQNLKYLHLGSNLIENLPNSIEKLVSLQALYMGGNRLTEVPETLGNLRSLKCLVLCDNQLESLPPSIARLENLRSLLLHKNSLRTLPQEIVELSGLTELSLRDNPLVVHFVRHMASRPLTLCELAARCVQTHRLPYEHLPRTLVSYLDTAHRCVNPQCQGVFFDSRVEHVKFVDFCGKYRVPLLQYLCSARCIGDKRTASADPPSDQLLRKVLLG